MKIKLSYLFILLCILVSCQEKSVINDLKFSNYAGNPKKITEIVTFANQNMDKSISYFDKDGFLTKIESYNLAKSEFPDQRLLSDILIYDAKNKTKRYFKSIDAESKKVGATGYFEKVSDSLYRRVSTSDTPTPPMSLNKLLYLDNNNRLIKTEETGNFNGTPINTTMVCTYINGVKSGILVEDLVNHKKTKMLYKNVKLDPQGNFVYEELVDDYGTLQLKTEREFEYY
ncbi:hypothetical protein EG347_06595 [Chryseobacterium sp. G0186]|uniref:hypothetical protein n=1 Tax=Chryseobacterium sp. G0186 TaxID=2487064 RepID=UPI000F4DFF1C|nr:hypothetical protein [Chryseobacterium sp. G0186]AZA77194.1 hypothetical protein EG347_06595 [Chryseobacterium sp. G0186]